MANWLNHLIDSAPLKAIYEQDIPTLKHVDFHSLELHRDGPSVILRFDLEQYPLHPPKKWENARYNRVQLRLLALDVQDLKITGLQPSCKLSISSYQKDNKIQLLGKGTGMAFSFSAAHLFIDGINAYRA